jgi:release factor glutamine methyltransferase
LRWASGLLEQNGIDSSARDARLLLRHVLNCTEEHLAGGGIVSVSPNQVDAFLCLIDRRRQGEPVAYIVGKKEFMGLEFAVDRRVLIPRPETEHLVECVLDSLGARPSADLYSSSGESQISCKQPLIADIGTGSGAIAASIAKRLPDATVFATDVSANALALARQNCLAHGVAGRVKFRQGSYLQALPHPVHVIVCNPPYIPSDDIARLDRDIRDYEPHVALSGGSDGLDAYRAMFADLPRLLLLGGTAFFEIGYNQAASLRALAARRLPGARMDVFRDYAGFDRVLRIAAVAPVDKDQRE